MIWKWKKFLRKKLWFLFFNFHSDGFDFSIKFKSIFAKFTTDSRLFETAEWNTSLENVITINPHCTSTKILTQVHGIGDIIGINSSCQTVICGVTTFNNLKIGIFRFGETDGGEKVSFWVWWLTSSRVLNLIICMTGPKISSLAILMWSWTSAKT